MADYIIYAGVEIADGAEVGPFVTIGVPPRGKKEGELATTIGPRAVIRSRVDQ